MTPFDVLSRTTEFNHVRMYMCLAMGYLLFQILFNFRDQLDFFKTRPSRPKKILGLFRIPNLTNRGMIICGVGLCCCMLAVLLNFHSRIVLCLSLILYFLYFGHITGLSYIRRKTHQIPLIFIILIFSPGLATSLEASNQIWPLLLVKLVLTGSYWSSAVSKLRHTGLRWANGETLQAHMMSYYLQWDNEACRFVGERLTLCAVMSGVTLFFELTFPIILLIPQLTWPYVATALGFHMATLWLMRINYLKYVTTSYLVFFTGTGFWVLDQFK